MTLDGHVEVEVDPGPSAVIPPDAVMALTLTDTSRVGARAETIGALHIEQIDSLPARFSIRYDPERIVHTHRYTVRATVSVGDALLYTTDAAHAVITRDAPRKAVVELVPVGSRRGG